MCVVRISEEAPIANAEPAIAQQVVRFEFARVAVRASEVKSVARRAVNKHARARDPVAIRSPAQTTAPGAGNMLSIPVHVFDRDMLAVNAPVDDHAMRRKLWSPHGGPVRVRRCDTG